MAQLGRGQGSTFLALGFHVAGREVAGNWSWPAAQCRAALVVWFEGLLRNLSGP